MGYAALPGMQKTNSMHMELIITMFQTYLYSSNVTCAVITSQQLTGVRASGNYKKLSYRRETAQCSIIFRIVVPHKIVKRMPNFHFAKVHADFVHFLLNLYFLYWPRMTKMTLNKHSRSQRIWIYKPYINYCSFVQWIVMVMPCVLLFYNYWNHKTLEWLLKVTQSHRQCHVSYMVFHWCSIVTVCESCKVSDVKPGTSRK